MNHLIRTSHHDTGGAEMFCGATRDVPTEEIPGAPICTHCIVAALESVDKRLLAELITVGRAAREDAVADMHKTIGWVDDITLRLERLERKANKKGGAK